MTTSPVFAFDKEAPGDLFCAADELLHESSRAARARRHFDFHRRLSHDRATKLFQPVARRNLAAGSRQTRRGKFSRAPAGIHGGQTRVHHLSRSLRVVRLADRGGFDQGRRTSDEADQKIRPAADDRRPENFPQRPCGLPRLRRAAAGNLSADQGRPVSRAWPEPRGQAMGKPHRRRRHARSPLLGGRHLHDLRRAGAGVSRHGK